MVAREPVLVEEMCGYAVAPVSHSGSNRHCSART
jgi:hypothetical protein